MSDHERPEDAFEPEVRAAFLRHLAELDRHVPAKPPLVHWSDRTEVDGRVSRRTAGPASRRERLATLPQLAGAFGAVGLVVVFAVTASLGMRWIQTGITGASEPAASGSATQAPSVEPSASEPEATDSASAYLTPPPTPTVTPTALPPGSPYASTPGAQPIEAFSVVYISAGDLTAMSSGYGGVGYVLDRAHGTVWVVTLAYGQEAAEAIVAGRNVGEDTVGTPRLLASGGCLLALDDKDQIWEWCNPGGGAGNGSLDSRYFAPAGSNLQITALAFWPARDPGLGYSLIADVLAVEPTRGQIVEYPVYPGSGRSPTDYLAKSRDLSGVTAMCVKGNAVFLLDRGSVVRFVDGQETDWQPQPSGKVKPYYGLIASGDFSETGRLYLYDRANHLLVAVNPADGSLVARYQATHNAWANEPRGMIVTLGGTQPDGYHAVQTVYWIAGAEVWGAGLP